VLIILLVIFHHLDDVILKKELYELAHFDNLTALPNRYKFLNDVSKLFNIAKRENLPFVLIFIDLDNFKDINDTLGHNYGDIVLQKVADIIRYTFIRATDSFCRLGGDEFLIFSIQRNEEKFESFLINFLNEIRSIKIKNFNISASIGALYIKKPSKNLILEKLIASADKIMYEVKKNGKNNYLIKFI